MRCQRSGTKGYSTYLKHLLQTGLPIHHGLNNSSQLKQRKCRKWKSVYWKGNKKKNGQFPSFFLMIFQNMAAGHINGTQEQAITEIKIRCLFIIKNNSKISQSAKQEIFKREIVAWVPYLYGFSFIVNSNTNYYIVFLNLLLCKLKTDWATVNLFTKNFFIQAQSILFSTSFFLLHTII